MEIRYITRDEWVNSLTEEKEDKFAYTFLSKADARNYWDQVLGYFIDGELAGGIVTTYSKRDPKTANLQLLHTFYKHRRKGVAKALTLDAYRRAYEFKCKYFRVSAEKGAVVFYESVGFKFWGRQKSGTSLSLFKMVSEDIKEGVYDKEDSYTYKKVFQMPGKIVTENE